ncbi:MAG: sialidase family protein [Candidatus Tumulicola sp.]
MKWLRWAIVVVVAGAAVSCGGRQNALGPAAQTGSDRFAERAPFARRLAGFEPEQLWGVAGRDDWEPVNAADPSSDWVYQMTTKQRPNFLLFRSSDDGGVTWNRSRHICRRGIKPHFQFDPQIVVAPDGTIDVVCLDNFFPGVVFTQSRDRGRTWSAPVRLDGFHRYSDKPTLAISASGTDVYVSFNVFDALYVAVSHDAGTTWMRPVRATTLQLWYYSYAGAVARDGSVWFGIDGESGSDQTGDGHIALARSSDGGATWNVIPMALTHEGAPCTERNCYPDFFTGEDCVAVDAAGTIVFAYAKNQRKQGPNRIYVRTSRDGNTWSDPIAITSQGNATSPAVAAGPRPGDFRLAWQDDRNGAHAWNTWYARSLDGGRTWGRNVRLSDRGSGAPYKNANGYDFPFGDYFGLSVDSNGVNHVIWGEGSAVYVPGGTWFTRGE